MIADGARPQFALVGLGRLAAFGFVFFLLQAAYESQRDGWVESVVIESVTVAPSAALVSALAPRVRARAVGVAIESPGEKLKILPGCEGAEAFLLLFSAVLCARRSLRATLVGLGLALVIVYVANIVRIVSLFFFALRDRPLFGLFHGYLAPLAVAGVGMIYFSLWLSWSQRDEPTH